MFESLKRLFKSLFGLGKAAVDQTTVVVEKSKDKLLTLDIIEKAEKEFKDQCRETDNYGNTLTELKITIINAERDLNTSKAELKEAENEYKELCKKYGANPSEDMKAACRRRLLTLKKMEVGLKQQEEALDRLKKTYENGIARIDLININHRTRELDLRDLKQRYMQFKALNRLEQFTFSAAGVDDTYFDKLNEKVEFEEAKAAVERDISVANPIHRKAVSADDIPNAEIDEQLDKDLAAAVETK